MWVIDWPALLYYIVEYRHHQVTLRENRFYAMFSCGHVKENEGRRLSKARGHDPCSCMLIIYLNMKCALINICLKTCVVIVCSTDHGQLIRRWWCGGVRSPDPRALIGWTGLMGAGWSALSLTPRWRRTALQVNRDAFVNTIFFSAFINMCEKWSGLDKRR